MLLSMPRLGERVCDVLNRWLSLQGDERRAVSLLIGLASEQNMALDLMFLAAVQALEALSRVDANEYELDEPEFQRRVGVVLGSVNERSARDWAERKLKFVNRRSFGDLLQDLASWVGEYIDSLAPDRTRLFDDIRYNRNFYTHRDERRAQRVLEGNDLYLLTQGIICLLKAAVLRRLGFSVADTKSLMDNCQGTLQWRVRVADLYPKPDETLT